MAASKPTLVLLHGSWHSKDVWQRVVPRLEQRGYKTITPQLSFCGTEKPIVSIEPCIDEVQAILSEETSSGRHVVLINHSFAGVAGCSSVKGYTSTDTSKLAPGASGRVIGIVQMSAMTVPANTDLREFLIGRVGMTPIAVPGPEGWDVFIKDPIEALYQDLDPKDAKEWASRLLKHSSSTRVQHERVYDGWKDVPLFYLLCTKDCTIPPASQEKMADLVREKNPRGVTMRELASGHSPMLSMPEQTVEVLVEAAEAFVAQHA